MGIKKDTLTPALKKLASKNRLKEVSSKGMKLAMESARNGVVSKTPRVTGRLVGSIQGFGGDDSVFRLESTGKKLRGFVGTKVEYAASVEFTSKKNKGFFKRGFGSKRKEMLQILKSIVKNVMTIK